MEDSNGRWIGMHDSLVLDLHCNNMDFLDYPMDTHVIIIFFKLAHKKSFDKVNRFRSAYSNCFRAEARPSVCTGQVIARRVLSVPPILIIKPP